MTGCIDIYGYAAETGSWLLCGWVPSFASGPLSGQRRVVLRFEGGELAGDALVAETVRGDLGALGVGVAVHLPGSDAALGALGSAVIEAADGAEQVVMQATPEVGQARDAALAAALQAQRLAPSGEACTRMRAVLARGRYDGSDTQDRFADRFAFKVDEAIPCGTADLLLNGWLVAAPPGVHEVRLRSGGRSVRLPLRDAVRVGRPDVVAKYGDLLGTRNPQCGFVLHAVGCLEPGQPPFIEIELCCGQVATVPVRLSRLRGLAAIRNTLANLQLRYDEVRHTFDAIGPALTALNRERLEAARSYREICFGDPPAEPACSVIVPLHGRIDYMEVQVALLAQGAFARAHELIYVVDDPDGADAACLLADSLFRRFGLPLRLLLLEENVGFAPACNAGLSVAAGSHVCFLNSDVFATEPGWLDRLLEGFRRHPSIGIIGPLLLFEDGTVQHAGLRYEALPEYGGWMFPVHPGKGSRRSGARGVTVHPAITGACMVMSRRQALELDGFDEGYVIGDFEDSDLCLRARQGGIACAVDEGVALYHLERKSQAGSGAPWRMNLTLYNAWLHQRRWGDRLAAERPGPPAAQGFQVPAPAVAWP